MRAVAVLGLLIAWPRAAAADMPPPPPPPPDPRLFFAAHGELITGLVVTRAAGHTDSRFTLERAEAGAEVQVDDHATGELVLEAIRSAAPDSAAGIDGDSIVVRVKRAAFSVRARPIQPVEVSASLGVIADPWLAMLADFPLRTLGVSAGEEQGLIASSDLGLGARLDVDRRMELQLAFTNGEGVNQVERNRGKDAAVLYTVRPPLGHHGLGALELHFYARDGAVGPASVRADRVGLALRWHHPRRFAAGADVLWAWGVGNRADVEGTTVDAWADLPIGRGLGLTLRWDQVALTGPAGGGDPPDRRRATGGPWFELGRTIRVIAAVQVERTGPGAPLAGVPTATDATRFMLLAQGRLSTRP